MWGASGNLRPAGLHPLLGTIPAGQVSDPAGDGERPIPPGTAGDQPLASPTSTHVDCVPTPSALAEAARAPGVLRDHWKRPALATVRDARQAPVAQVAQPPLSTGWDALESLCAASRTLPAPASCGRPLSLPPCSESLIPRSRMRQLRTSGSEGGRGRQLPRSTRPAPLGARAGGSKALTLHANSAGCASRMRRPGASLRNAAGVRVPASPSSRMSGS